MLPLFPWWIKYPNVNNEIQNLDWLLYTVRHLSEEVKNFINLNTIKYADPILWDITSQYEANTIVVDPQTGDAFISTKPVPYGVSLNNTDYWTKIYNYADAINKLEEQIAAANERLSTTASAPRSVGDLVWLNGLLYRVTADMIAGDSYVVDSNCVKTTIEEELQNLIDAVDLKIGNLSDLSTTDKSNLVAAINEVLTTLSTNIGNLSDLTTTDKTNIVAAINEVVTNLDNYLPKNNPEFSGIMKNGDTYTMGASFGFGNSADCFKLVDGVPGDYKTDEEPTIRTQMFTNLAREESQPWAASVIHQAVVGASAEEKVCTTLNEIFSYAVGHLEHIATINVAHARADSDTSPTGAVWGEWSIALNHGFVSSLIGMEANFRNTTDNYYDSNDPIGDGEPARYCIGVQIFPDWSTKHGTRGLSIEPSSLQLGEPVGFSTGALITGFVDRGIYIDTNIQYKDPVTHLQAADPADIVFGFYNPSKLVFRNSKTEIGTELRKVDTSLIWYNRVRNLTDYFLAFDESTGNVVTPNGKGILKNNGRIVVGDTTDTSNGTSQPGITIKDANLLPLVIERSTSGSTAPGKNYGCLKFLPGTNAGTLKLVAFAGTSNTGVTIIDNVGAGND